MKIIKCYYIQSCSGNKGVFFEKIQKKYGVDIPAQSENILLYRVYFPLRL